VGAADFDDVGHEWHVRAALWAGDWARAARAIAMPEALRTRIADVPGRARAKAMTMKEARVEHDVVPTDNWYAVLSASRLGERFAPTLQEVAHERAIDSLRSPRACECTASAALRSRVGRRDGMAQRVRAAAPAQRRQAIGRRPLGLASPGDRRSGITDALQRLPCSIASHA
jgi:hypothetical protein